MPFNKDQIERYGKRYAGYSLYDGYNIYRRNRVPACEKVIDALKLQRNDELKEIARKEPKKKW
jgi:hypothetical protein